MKICNKESGKTNKNWEKIFETDKMDKILVSRIFKEFS